MIAPLVSDGQTTESTEEAQEEKDPLIPEIDTSVEIQAGSRVAVVSKSTSGEFWGLVKKGMEFRPEMQRKNISKRIFDIDFFLTRWDNMRGGKCLISCIATKKRISYF